MYKNPVCFGYFKSFLSVLNRRPNASAKLRGSNDYPDIKGTVNFYQTRLGVLVSAEVFGLPDCDADCCGSIFAVHIHSGRDCTGNSEDAFADAMSHYNPENCPHPYHAGDMPVLFGNKGYAFQIFFTDRFTVDGITGRTVIIHSNPDDFTTQPSGNAKVKIACGEIEKL